MSYHVVTALGTFGAREYRLAVLLRALLGGHIVQAQPAARAFPKRRTS